MHFNTYSTYASNTGKRKSGETVHPGKDCQSCGRCGTTAEIQKIERRVEAVGSGCSRNQINPKSCLCHKYEQDLLIVLIIIKISLSYDHKFIRESLTRGIVSKCTTSLGK